MMVRADLDRLRERPGEPAPAERRTAVRVLVTGISGFAGPSLARALVERGPRRCTASARHPPGARRRVAPLVVPRRRRPRRRGRSRAWSAAVAPDARRRTSPAVAEPAARRRDPEAAYRVNLGGTLALLAAVRAAAPRRRACSWSARATSMARSRPRDLPVDEDTPLRPLTVYGASKAAAEVAALQWARAYGLDVVRRAPVQPHRPRAAAGLRVRGARPPGGGHRERPPAAACSRWATSIRCATSRDVRDVAAGYVALLERGRGGDGLQPLRRRGRQRRRGDRAAAHASRASRCAARIDPARRRRARRRAHRRAATRGPRRDTGWAAAHPARRHARATRARRLAAERSGRCT